MPVVTSTLNYLEIEELRHACGDLTENDFDDNHLAEIISNWEVVIHKAVGRTTTSVWTTADEVYNIMKQALLFGCKSQVFEEMDDKDAESTKAFERYEYFLGLLKDVTAGEDSSGDFQDTVGIDGFVAI